MLASHLDRCSDCRMFASDVESFTHDLRAAPLEPLGFPIELRRARRAVLGRVQIGVAAAVAVAVVASLLQLGTPSSRPSTASYSSPTLYPTSAQVQREVRQIVAAGREFDRHKGGDTAFPM